MLFSEFMNESKEVTYKQIVKEFEQIDTVRVVNVREVEVSGDIAGSADVKVYKFNHKEVAEEVANKLKNFIGIR